MGFYPKHLHCRRERYMLRIIAMAALGGATFQSVCRKEQTAHYNYNGDALYCRVKVWRVVYPDGVMGPDAVSRLAAAKRYLHWLEFRHQAGRSGYA